MTGWKTKKEEINSFSKKDNECLSICLKAKLNHEDFKKDPQRLTRNKAFIDKYNGGRNELNIRKKYLEKIGEK